MVFTKTYIGCCQVKKPVAHSFVPFFHHHVNPRYGLLVRVRMMRFILRKTTIIHNRLLPMKVPNYDKYIQLYLALKSIG